MPVLLGYQYVETDADDTKKSRPEQQEDKKQQEDMQDDGERGPPTDKDGKQDEENEKEDKEDSEDSSTSTLPEDEKEDQEHEEQVQGPDSSTSMPPEDQKIEKEDGSIRGRWREQIQAAADLLLDLHERLRISLPLQEGGHLQMKLNSGVLQGGGTGPRLFRIAYDDCVSAWKDHRRDDNFDLAVEYMGASYKPGVAAYADDLVRISSGKSLASLQQQDETNRETLRTLLQVRGLHLNDRKGETLLHFCGAGAYNSAKLAFSGSWSGYPLKLQVKYLGAMIQGNGSHAAELQKRIGSAKAGFARFARFFRKRTVPLQRKFLVFKAVVNEALLSALEVRPLNKADEHQLEKARGLLLRRLFGRDGFGAVAGDPQHKSVPLHSLRQKARLATVASELRVRRLLWLRGALFAEKYGQVRLELATLFGSSSELGNCVEGGVPTVFAPKFLHILHRDLTLLAPAFAGFLGNWKDDFLQIPARTLHRLRVFTEDAGATDAEPDQPRADEVVVSIVCDLCGEGPWKNLKALNSHKVRKHAVRNPVQVTECPQCNRKFSSKTACQRHVKNRSCGKPVTNHGHAGALAGQRSAAGTSPSARPPKRVRHEAAGNPQQSMEKKVQDLSRQLQQVCQLVSAHDQSLRELEAWSTRTYILAADTELATLLAQHMTAWKDQLPAKGQAHPQGPARHTVAAAFAKWLLQSQERRAVLTKFAELHDQMTQIEDMSKSIQLCFAKTIRDGRLLLKVRPRQSAMAAWQEVFDWMDASLESLQAETKDVAPAGPLARALGRKERLAETDGKMGPCAQSKTDQDHEEKVDGTDSSTTPEDEKEDHEYQDHEEKVDGTDSSTTPEDEKEDHEYQDHEEKVQGTDSSTTPEDEKEDHEYQDHEEKVDGTDSSTTPEDEEDHEYQDHEEKVDGTDSSTTPEDEEDHEYQDHEEKMDGTDSSTTPEDEKEDHEYQDHEEKVDGTDSSTTPEDEKEDHEHQDHEEKMDGTDSSTTPEDEKEDHDYQDHEEKVDGTDSSTTPEDEKEDHDYQDHEEKVDGTDSSTTPEDEKEDHEHQDHEEKVDGTDASTTPEGGNDKMSNQTQDEIQNASGDITLDPATEAEFKIVTIPTPKQPIEPKEEPKQLEQSGDAKEIAGAEMAEAAEAAEVAEESSDLSNATNDMAAEAPQKELTGVSVHKVGQSPHSAGRMLGVLGWCEHRCSVAVPSSVAGTGRNATGDSSQVVRRLAEAKDGNAVRLGAMGCLCTIVIQTHHF
eukprot:Skav216509  [mRNA]  locus=scaffold1123:676329:681818:- [translate_table: standard]